MSRSPMSRMILAPLAVVLALSGPALARDDTAREPTIQERMEELVDRLMGRLQPGFEALEEMMGDLSGWHAPEFLPNGDILIRRRQPADPEPEAAPEDDPVTDPLEL